MLSEDALSLMWVILVVPQQWWLYIDLPEALIYMLHYFNCVNLCCTAHTNWISQANYPLVH